LFKQVSRQVLVGNARVHAGGSSFELRVKLAPAPLRILLGSFF